MTTYPPPTPGRCPVCRRCVWLPHLWLGDAETAPRQRCSACGYVDDYAAFQAPRPMSCRCPGCRAAFALQAAHLHILQAEVNPFEESPAHGTPFTTCPQCGFLSEHAVFLFPGTEPSHMGLRTAHPFLAKLAIKDALAAIDGWLAAPDGTDTEPVLLLRAWWASR